MFWKKKFTSHQTWIQDLQTPTDKTSLSYTLCKRVQPNRNFATEALTLILIWPTLLKKHVSPECSMQACCLYSSYAALHITLPLLPISLQTTFRLLLGCSKLSLGILQLPQQICDKFRSSIWWWLPSGIGYCHKSLHPLMKTKTPLILDNWSIYSFVYSWNMTIRSYSNTCCLYVSSDMYSTNQ